MLTSPPSMKETHDFDCIMIIGRELGELVRDRVGGDFSVLDDLADRLHEPLGLAKATLRSHLDSLYHGSTTYPFLPFNMTVTDPIHLHRLSVVLSEFEISTDALPVKRLEKCYGSLFTYPPGDAPEGLLKKTG